MSAHDRTIETFVTELRVIMGKIQHYSNFNCNYGQMVILTVNVLLVERY